MDSAFTLTWDHTYDKLLEAVQAATNTGVRVRFDHSNSAGHSSHPRKPALTYGSATSPQPSRKQWNPTRSRSGEKSYLVGLNHV